MVEENFSHASSGQVTAEIPVSKHRKREDSPNTDWEQCGACWGL